MYSYPLDSDMMLWFTQVVREIGHETKYLQAYKPTLPLKAALSVLQRVGNNV